MTPRRFCDNLSVLGWMLLISHSLSAQPIMQALATHYKKYPQEKVYVHTDKQIYVSGQTIWYKIYATVYGSPGTLSKIVHVQLIDPDGKVMLYNKLLLSNGRAHGDLQIPEGLRSNFYQIRCFTAWMLNFGESGLFHKTVYIKNLSDTFHSQAEIIPVQKNYTVQFFPEGGDLIDKITATVAFKATDQYGLPVAVHGEIRDELQTLVDSFRTTHEGMGKFSFRPLAPHRYYALVSLPNQTEKAVQLPPVRKSGLGMRVTEQSQDAFTLQLVYHESSPGQYRNILLSASQQSGKLASYPLELSAGINLFSISNRGFTDGILRLTVFDSSGLPLAERILFVRHQGALQWELQADTASFAPKTKSAFTLVPEGAEPGTPGTSLSVAVTDADRAALAAEEENIYSSLLLTSELKGRIHDPGAYFTAGPDSSRQGLDLVMLSNGWRHFAWSDIAKGEPFFLHYAVEDSLFIAGKIGGYQPSAKKDHLFKLMIQQADSIRFIGYIAPDTTGSFILKDYQAPGQSTMFFLDKVRKGRHNKYHVSFYENSIDSLRAPGNFVLPAATRVDSMKTLMKKTWDDEGAQKFLHKRGDLKTVTIRGYIPSKSEILAKEYISPEFALGRGFNIDLVNDFYPNSVSLFDLIKGRFPGLLIFTGPDSISFSYRNSAQNELVKVRASTNGVNDAITTSEPYVYVDEIPSSIPAVRDIPISDIALIRFMPPPAAIAPYNGGVIGVLAIYLKKYSEKFKSLDVANTYDRYIFQGYALTREFYSPDYSRKDSSYFQPDMRETIYWNPDMQTGPDNRIHFSFYNSDHAKRFRIVAEGMDEQGHLVYLSRIVSENTQGKE
jgi:hypothetical protein